MGAIHISGRAERDYSGRSFVLYHNIKEVTLRPLHTLEKPLQTDIWRVAC